MMVALSTAPIAYNYVEKWCGSVNDQGTQKGFILKVLLLSEMLS